MSGPDNLIRRWLDSLSTATRVILIIVVIAIIAAVIVWG
jgi:hypothetical protein